MEAKCNSSQYRIAEEFRADAQLIVHNIVIFHGGDENQGSMLGSLDHCFHKLSFSSKTKDFSDFCY
jgi:hypothetical protein